MLTPVIADLAAWAALAGAMLSIAIEIWRLASSHRRGHGVPGTESSDPYGPPPVPWLALIPFFTLALAAVAFQGFAGRYKLLADAARRTEPLVAYDFDFASAFFAALAIVAFVIGAGFGLFFVIRFLSHVGYNDSDRDEKRARLKKYGGATR